MNPFTVVLIYPDYASSDYPSQNYTAHVEADNVSHAITKAQEEVANHRSQADDFLPIAVMRGHHANLTL